MKKIFAATAAAALMVATGAWAQSGVSDSSSTAAGGPPGGSVDSVGTQGNSSYNGNGPTTVGGGNMKSTLGSAGAPGVTGTRGGSSTDSNPTTGGTGQPGTGIRQNLGETTPQTSPGTAGEEAGGAATHSATGH